MRAPILLTICLSSAVAGVVLIPITARSADAENCPQGMRYLPGGSFKSARDGKAIDAPPLCIDTFEVTVKEYTACQKMGKCSAAPTGENCNAGKADRGDHPINCVDWNQANAYCAAQGKRLPSFGEYEWAARGGPAGTMFPWGNAKPKNQLCWAGNKGNPGTEEFHSSTCPVGQAKGDVSPQGVHDLAGDVAEWTSTPGTAGDDHYLGGGSGWSWGEIKYVSASGRTHATSTDHEFAYGFRCVTPAPGHPK